MKTYQTIRPTENSNLTVKELNAAVLTAIFPSKQGTFEADLYKSNHTCNELVYAGSCAPCNAEFINTVIIIIN